MMLMMLACTAVKDPSERWKGSGMDPKLEGEWKEVRKEEGGEKKFTFTKHEGNWYSLEENAKDPLAMRTFTRGGRHFMLLLDAKLAEAGPDKAPPDKRGGLVWFYDVEGDTLRLSMLKDEAVAKAIADGRLKGEVPEKKEGAFARSEPSLATLDDATCDALAKLAEDKDAFEQVAEYKRVKPEAKPENGK
jgi:hypothetical protein